MQISHRIIQLTFKKALADQEIQLEQRFPTINRIADVAWPAENIVFEIQCSPISVKEMQARHRDYQKIGFTVIWILHDRHFNRLYLTPAERFLRSYPHYFTNINSLGHGEIYDQYAHIRWGKRIVRTPRFPITLHQLSRFPQMLPHFPKARRQWKLCFGGDCFHQNCQLPKTTFTHMYRLLFHFLLEKRCH